MGSFSENLKSLNWISPYFENPDEELKILKNLHDILKNDKSNKMLITEYNFFSSILSENLNTPSRTFDNISYPKKIVNISKFIKNF